MEGEWISKVDSYLHGLGDLLDLVDAGDVPSDVT